MESVTYYIAVIALQRECVDIIVRISGFGCVTKVTSNIK